jgi:hypothetical protein
MGCVGLGVAFLPILMMTASFSPQIISNLLALTVGSFGGASLLVYAFPKLPLFRFVGLLGGVMGGLLV